MRSPRGRLRYADQLCRPPWTNRYAQTNIPLGPPSGGRSVFEFTVGIMATRRTHWATLLAAAAMLLFTSVAAVAAPVERPLPSLVVAPLDHIASYGPKGGPFSPSSFQYRVSASSGTVNYSIRNPSWLTVSSSFGVTDVTGVTITFTVNSTASQLAPGKYGPGVAFTNVTNGQGSAARPATLIIQGPSSPSPALTIQRPSSPSPALTGSLLDADKGYLLDERNGRLLAR